MAWFDTQETPRFTINQIVLASEQLENKNGYFEKYSELRIFEIDLFGRYSVVDEYGHEVLNVPENMLILPEEKEIYEKQEKTFELKIILALAMVGLILFVCVGFFIYQYIYIL